MEHVNVYKKGDDRTRRGVGVGNVESTLQSKDLSVKGLGIVFIS